MKFGKNLESNKVPEFSAHYINYKGLKKLIKQANNPDDLAQEPDLTAFFFELDRSVEDIDFFFNKRSADVDRRLHRLESRFRVGPVSDMVRLDLPSEEWEELVAAMVDLRSSLQKLTWFAEVNKQGIVKILKKLEKKTSVTAKDAFLEAKVNILPFAAPTAVQDSMHLINRWLSKIVPVDLRNMTEAPTTDNMRRVRSIVHMGVAVEQANALENLMQKDDAVALCELLSDMQPQPKDAILSNLLQQALIRHSFESARLLLGKLTSLLLLDDINERNVIHKLLIVQGRRICKTKEGRNGSPLADEMFITPAIPPAINLSIGNPALDFGSRTRDDILEDDPAALKFLLSNMKISMRQCLDQRDSHQRLPLHYAAEYGLEKCTQVLLSYMLDFGFLKPNELLEDPRFVDSDGLTPVHLCIKYKYPVTLNVLLRATNLTNKRTYEVRRTLKPDGLYVNPMSLAIGVPSIIRILLDAGINVNLQNERGETCIHEAARRGDVESINEFLVQTDLQKPNLQLTEKTYGWTPLFVAAVEGQKEVVAVLAAATPDSLDRVDLSGWTAMEHAVFRGHIALGKLLQPIHPPGPNSTFDKPSRPKIFRDALSTESISGTRTPEPISKPVKSFGHRYLKDRAMVIVTLGSTDTRSIRGPIQLDRVPIEEAGTTRLDTALSLVVSAKCAEGDTTTFDLPLGDSPTTEPLLFTAVDPTKVQLFFDIVPTYAASGAKKLGRAVALLSTIKTKVGSQRASLWGAVTVPIIEAENMSVIGTVEFEFSVVTPFTHPQMNIEKESTYWKSLMTTRVIGHRGLGKNVNQPDRRSLQLGENTVQSFVAAANLGASYVEFDVQITKDLVPVIYHDFLVSQTGIDAPVHALTLEQFMSTSAADSKAASRNSSRDRVSMLQKGQNPHRGRSRSLSSTEVLENLDRMKYTRDFKLKGFKGNQRGHSVQDSFSTLAEVFKKVPQTVGFNIECKYPMLSEAEEEEMDNTAIEINQWVDTVLKCVYDHANGRDIIFSSFHPDVCLLLALKQPTIPCLFLTEAGTTYLCDVRGSSIQEAIRFASRWNLLGIVSACEPFVMCPRLVRVVKESGLVCVSYGILNNLPDHVNAQVAAGVDAVIVDSVLAIRKGLTAESGHKQVS